MADIHQAAPEDIAGIATVVREVWQREIDLDLCRSQIEDNSSAIWVASEELTIAGFVSSFLTVEGEGMCRWEVDLLAVRQTGRGQRLGQKLVEATWTDVWKHQARLARAAVRVDNIASQRTFRRAGYTTDGRVHKLLVWSPEPVEGQIVCPKGVTFLPVDTLTYRGLWLEGLTSAGVCDNTQQWAVKAARALIAQQGRVNTGALIPIEDEHCLADDLRAIATIQGEYHWWRKLMEPT